MLTTTFALAGAAHARTVKPELLKMTYWDSSGRPLYVTTETDFWSPASCGTNCTSYTAVYFTSARQNEIQMRMIVGDTWPTNESCWYYDHDGPEHNWHQISLEPKCRHYYESDGKPRTWMTETVDLRDGGSNYWTVFSNCNRAPYMAYGYRDGSQYKYIWVYSGCPIVV